MKRKFVFTFSRLLSFYKNAKLKVMRIFIALIFILFSASCGDGICLQEDNCISSTSIPSTTPSSGRVFYVSDATNNAIYKIDENGNRTIISNSSTGTGPILSPRHIVLSSDKTKIFTAIGGASSGVYSIDVSTGNRTYVSNGSGVPFSVNIFGTATDSTSTKVFVSDTTSDAIHAVDLSTGGHSIVSDGTVGTGLGFNSVRNIVSTNSGTELYVSDTSGGALIMKVDVATGNRVVLSSYSFGAGAGPDWSSISGFALSPLEDTIYVTTAFDDSIYKVDVASGNRTLLSSPVVGSGPLIDGPAGITVSDDGQTLYVADPNTPAIFSIDIATGTRKVISSNSVGTGPLLGSPYGIVITYE